jgi:hypothetical protein
MSATWRCTECGETGTQPTREAARRAYEHHFLDHHNDPEF